MDCTQVDYVDAQIMAAAVERFVRRKIDEGLNKSQITEELEKEIEKGDWDFCLIPKEDIIKEAGWCHSWLEWHDKNYKK